MLGMNQAATTALEENLPLVAEMIRNAFIDDLNGSYSLEAEVKKLRDELREFMRKQGLLIKGIAITGDKPETSLLLDDHVIVGRWKWTLSTDKMSLHSPDIYLGKKVKGKY